MTRKRRRLYLVLGGMATLGIVTALVLTAFSGSLVFFYSPSELAAKHVPPGTHVRIGGIVEKGSIVHESGGQTILFRVTDGKRDVGVHYSGALPDLFREGQGVVVEGALQANGVFDASTVLAKHDARYMPPEVVAALKKAGRWKGAYAATEKP